MKLELTHRHIAIMCKWFVEACYMTGKAMTQPSSQTGTQCFKFSNKPLHDESITKRHIACSDRKWSKYVSHFFYLLT